MSISPTLPSEAAALRAAPSHGFSRFALSPALQQAIAAAGFSQPRPIQSQTIPAALAGRDILGLAQTGTGKTAAFALPVLERLLARQARGPRALVIAPTRELAMQIDADFRRFAKLTRVRTVTIFGGVSERPQIAELRRQPDVIVACPGRLLDLYGQRHVALDRVEMLVLDEADHMFDMGFLPDVRRILSALPERRQNLLFSATMPPEIRGLANQVLRDPIVVELAHSAPATTIDHVLYPVPEKRKLELLQHLLAESEYVSALIFTRTKHRAKRLARDLDKLGHRSVALQGNMSQNARDRAMSGFRSGHFDILVATDIASRGIDVDQISHVINFDIPTTPEAYTHRIGRTGRSERSGKAYTFVNEEDRDVVRAIERRLGATIPRCYVKGFEGVSLPVTAPGAAAGQPARNGGGRGRPGVAPRNGGFHPRPARHGASHGRRSRPRRFGG